MSETQSCHLGITIVIPHRDCPTFLLDAISSVLRQRMRVPFEIIVVDDCSATDESSRVLAHLAGHPRVQVLQSDSHVGVQIARNLGVSAAQHEYILPLDADDMIREPAAGRSSFLARGARMLAADETLAFVHTGSWMIGESTGPTISSYPLTSARIAKKHHVPTSIVFRRADALAGAVYDESISKWQDWSFGVELLASRWHRGLTSRIGFISGNHHLYRIHDVPERISRADIDEYEMTLRTVRRHRDYFTHCHGTTDSIDQLARIVFDAKPTKLTDLLLMARHDIKQAYELVACRDARLVTSVDALGVP